MVYEAKALGLLPLVVVLVAAAGNYSEQLCISTTAVCRLPEHVIKFCKKLRPTDAGSYQVLHCYRLLVCGNVAGDACTYTETVL